MTVRARRVHWRYNIWPHPCGWRYQVKVRPRPWRPWGPRYFERGIHDGPRELAESFVLDQVRKLLDRFARHLP